MLAIIDDEQDIVILFRDYLQTLKMPIFTFTDPLLALEHFQVNKEKYHLVISDLRMPALDGIELLKKIKEKNPFVRRILMTAFKTDDKIFEDYLKDGLIDGFLEKPVKLQDLLKEVKKQISIINENKKFSPDIKNINK